MAGKVAASIGSCLEAIYSLREENGVAWPGKLVELSSIVPGTITNMRKRYSSVRYMLCLQSLAYKFQDKGGR